MGDRLQGKVAVVTGAASGIGRATAARFAAEGAAVVVNDVDEPGAAAAAREIVEAGGRAVAVAGDVTDAARVEEVVATAVATFGRLDVMHNNAGYGEPSTVATMPDAELQRMLDVNLFGVLHGTRAALAVMLEQGSGSIINTASAAASGASLGRASYGVAKAAVVNLTRSTAVENARFGIRANAICPGPILTPALERFLPDPAFYADQLPTRRLGRPEDIAAVALFLASDDSAYVSGVSLPVDGAMQARLNGPYLTPDAIGRD